MASSMPRTGGDYVWVSRILSPPLATVSNFGAALSAMIGATFWARYFPVFALGPTLVTFGIFFHNSSLIAWGDRFQTDHVWIFLGGLFMILLMTALLIAGTKMTFRWQNTFWIIASAGTFLAFIVLAFGSSHSFQAHFNQLSARFGAHGDSYHHVINAVRGSISTHPNAGIMSSTLPAIFVIMTFMMRNWWSVCLSGELKSASNRNRHLKIMFTEDSATGAASANAAGLLCVGVRTAVTHAHDLGSATLVVNSLEELDPATLERLIPHAPGSQSLT